MKLTPARIILLFLVPIVLLSDSAAVQLTPDVVARFDLKDGDAYRGLELVSSLAYGAGVSLDYDLIKLDFEYYDYNPGLDREIFSARGQYRLAYSVREQPVFLYCGVRGELFSGDRDVERHEVFLGIEDKVRAFGGCKLRWDIAVDPGSDNAVYSDVAVRKTIGLFKNVDLDMALGLGFGDEDFAINHLELISETDAVIKRWYDAHASATLVFMTSWFDFLAYVRHEEVLGSGARDFISRNNTKAYNLSSGLALCLYWD